MDWQEWLQSRQVIRDFYLGIWLKIKSPITTCLIWCYAPYSWNSSIIYLKYCQKISSWIVLQFNSKNFHHKHLLKQYKLQALFDFRDLIEDLIVIFIPLEIVIWLRSWLHWSMIWWIIIWGFDLGFFRTLVNKQTKRLCYTPIFGVLVTPGTNSMLSS